VEHIDDAGRLIEDGHGGGPKAETADLARPVEIERRVEFLLRRDAHADAAGDATLRLASLPNAAAALVHQLADGNSQRQLHAAGIVHVAADAIQLRSVAAGVAWVLRIGRYADRLEPIGAAVEDVRHASQRL